MKYVWIEENPNTASDCGVAPSKKGRRPQIAAWYHQKGRRTLPKARAGIGVEKKEVGRRQAKLEEEARRWKMPHAQASEMQPPAGKMAGGAWMPLLVPVPSQKLEISSKRSFWYGRCRKNRSPEKFAGKFAEKVRRRFLGVDDTGNRKELEGESILEEARVFAKKHLEACLQQNIDENLAILVSHALELPLHWRMLSKAPRGSEVCLQVVEKHTSWRKAELCEDRLMENFLWTVGEIFEPQFGYCRRMLTKVNAMITTIDDVYDVYGTLEELELFTDAVDRLVAVDLLYVYFRWDINAMDQLPEYMKICFLALYNSTNEMAYDILKEQGSHIIAYLRKAWADLFKSYLLEAKWHHARYTSTLQEYLSNAWISISAPVILVHAFFFVTNPITEDALECMEQYCNIIRWSSIILRLSDDLGTSSDELKRGDVPKSIQCYMHETGACEEDAREHIKCLIGETWKKMNEDRVVESPFSQTFIGIAINLARMSQCMYQYGDGHGVQNRETKDHG
ncbi:(-)-alpha-terpineol synthase [Vitis vinifera]|uniref:(-)-alpha-terpineol synthase n=1 Tax=Vitis vinifera TaxID=29760 RepID=A0A438GG57_VITVI|nr:(-)-alpha-terpineol synthase [Vitis vinifera]